MGRKAGIRTEHALKRDEEILELLSAGFTYEEISKKLFIAPGTLATLVYDMRKQRNAKTTFQLVAMYAAEKMAIA